LPRDLSDVLHYFGPELAEPKGSRSSSAKDAGASSETSGQARASTRALHVVGVPIGERDVVRAAFTWNLAVEVARLGGRAIVIAPDDPAPSPLWPQAGTGPLGVELLPSLATDLPDLLAVAQQAASAKLRGGAEGGLVFVRIPPQWLDAPGKGSELLRWTLLFTSSRTPDLKGTLGMAKTIMGHHPQARVGITIHGAESRLEAETAFGRLARSARQNLGHDLTSYGLLVDDLQVYRAIVAQRPIGLAHPQSPAARALRDVAQLLLSDAEVNSVD